MERIRSQDGTPIAAWHSGVGAPLLLVHGTTGDHTGWTSVRAALERHFTVWTLDRRGRGSSGDAEVLSQIRDELRTLSEKVDSLEIRLRALEGAGAAPPRAE